MESGDSEREQIFSHSEDECDSKIYLTYAEYTKLSKGNVQMKRKAILQTSDSSNSDEESKIEQDC